MAYCAPHSTVLRLRINMWSESRHWLIDIQSVNWIEIIGNLTVLNTFVFKIFLHIVINSQFKMFHLWNIALGVKKTLLGSVSAKIFSFFLTYDNYGNWLLLKRENTSVISWGELCSMHVVWLLDNLDLLYNIDLILTSFSINCVQITCKIKLEH